jgi:hypothetical protein
MTWWLKRHRAGAVAVAFGVYAALVVTVGDALVPLPRVAIALTDLLPLRLVLPMIMVSVLMWAKSGDAPERGATRAVQLYWGVFVIAILAMSAVLCLAAATLTLVDDAWAVQRNLMGFLGLAGVLARYFKPETATALTVAVVVGGMLVPRLPSGALLPGAWPIVDSGAGASWWIALCLFAAAVVLHGRGAVIGYATRT